MTNIAPEVATFVRKKKPNSPDFYKTAQETFRVSNGGTYDDSHAWIRFKVEPPRREEILSLFLDVYLEEGSSIPSGNLQAQLMRLGSGAFRNYTFNRVPNPVAGQVPFSGVVSGRRIRFDVTSLYGIYELEDGSVSPWMVFRLTRNTTTGVTALVGPKGGRWAPRLVMTTQAKNFDPTDLTTGIVSTPKPVIEWTAPLEAFDLQVQVDELGGDFSTPLLDHTGGGWSKSSNRVFHYALTGSSWTGIPTNGSVTYRVRHRRTGGVWSEWVEADLEYRPHVARTLTNPGATDADPTPPVVWSPAADSFQVIVTRGNKVVEDSGLQAGPATDYTPSKGAVTDGETVRREVRLFDEYDRVATRGTLPYVSLVQDTVWTKTDTVPPLTSLDVWQDGESPLVIAQGARGSVPDEAWFGWDGSEGQLVDGVDGLSVRDWTVPPNTTLPYLGRAVVNNKHSLDVSRTIRTKVTGVWLVDPETERGFVLAGVDGLEIASGEVVVVNEPISAAALIRRTLVLRDEAGTIAGQIHDWPGRTRDQQREDVLWMRDRPERVYRLVCGDLNIPVTASIGKPVVDAQMSFHDRLLHNVSFAFSHAGDDE